MPTYLLKVLHKTPQEQAKYLPWPQAFGGAISTVVGGTIADL